MHTNREALQKIFEAALRQPDPEEINTPRRNRLQQNAPRRMHCNIDGSAAVATPPRRQLPVETEPVGPTVTAAATITPYTTKPRIDVPAAVEQPVEQATAPAEPQTPAIDAKAADELGAMLDAKLSGEASKRMRGKLLTAAVVVGSLGAGVIWFIQSPERVQTLTSATKEIQSATDVQQIVASYDESLDKVASRANQLDEATAAMGVSTELKEGEDAYMDNEMKAMMGGEGQTTGSRARAMQTTFGEASTQGNIIPSR